MACLMNITNRGRTDLLCGFNQYSICKSVQKLWKRIIATGSTTEALNYGAWHKVRVYNRSFINQQLLLSLVVHDTFFNFHTIMQHAIRTLLFTLHWEGRNNLQTIKGSKAKWTGHILRRNCLLKRVFGGKIKGRIEVMERRGRRRKQLLDDLKEARGSCKLKEEALDLTLWGNGFGRVFGPVVRQRKKWMT